MHLGLHRELIHNFVIHNMKQALHVHLMSILQGAGCKLYYISREHLPRLAP